MAEWLEGAKLQFACSAHYIDHVDPANLTTEQQTFLRDIPDPMFRETIRDFMMNQQFRRDYWVKGARKLASIDQTEAIRNSKVMLVSPRNDIVLKVNGALGEAELSANIYNPILDTLSDRKIKSIAQIEQTVGDKGVTLAQILQAVMVLCGSGRIAAVQDDADISKAKKQTDKLNQHICHLARGSNDVSFLASPVTGGGFPVSRFQQLFLLSIAQGKKQASDWAQFSWQILASQGQKILKDGKTLETAEENLAELTSQAREFADKQLPILKALQIA